MITSKYKRCEPVFVQKLHVEHPVHRRYDFKSASMGDIYFIFLLFLFC